MGWLDVVGIGLVTAVTEEVVFSGYLLQKIKGFVVSEWMAITLTGLGFALLHLPIAIFVYGYGGGEMLGFLVVIMLMAMGNYWVMMRTRNVIAPILSHWWWGVAIYMFG
jgi:membrane protease YdiL (CAAX protease family)